MKKLFVLSLFWWWMVLKWLDRKNHSATLHHAFSMAGLLYLVWAGSAAIFEGAIALHLWLALRCWFLGLDVQGDLLAALSGAVVYLGMTAIAALVALVHKYQRIREEQTRINRDI